MPPEYAQKDPPKPFLCLQEARASDPSLPSNPLGFVAGDSSWLTVIPSAVSGVQFTTRSKVVDTLGGCQGHTQLFILGSGVPLVFVIIISIKMRY